jgi:FAD/FMN-containing dehydrogenase
VNPNDSRRTVPALRALLSADQVLDDPDSRAVYGTDWTRVYPPDPLAVVFPRSVDEVAAIVRFANERRLPLVPSGGRTGLSGGAVAARQEIVVSLRDLNRFLDFSAVDRTVGVEAGVATAAVQTYARERDLFFPIDFAAAGSAQIGGNVATNAGGVRVVRHGSMRDWVAGLKVVTGTGEILDLNRGLVKNATGYDLRHLFIGSEGTLGIVVEATLRLTDPPGPRAVLLAGVRDFRALVDLFVDLRRACPLGAYEFFSDSALASVLAAKNLKSPLGQASPFYALAEVETKDEAALAPALAALERATSAGYVTDAVVAREETECRRLWQLRESISETIAPRLPYKNDLSVVVSALPEFLAAADALVSASYPGWEILWYGHIGDGNLHLNILRPEDVSREDFLTHCDAMTERISSLVGRFGGSVSAEHGVGLLKKKVLHHSRSAAEIAAMREIKKAFDPQGILNPGKIFS